MKLTKPSLITRAIGRLKKKKRFLSKIKETPRVDSSLYSPSVTQLQPNDKLSPLYAYDGSEVTVWKRQSRSCLANLLGPIEEVDIVNSRLLWTANDNRGSIRKLQLFGEDNKPFPVYMCIPFEISPPYNWIICLQGHSSGMHNSIGVDRDEEKYEIDVAKNSRFSDWCLMNGFAALCIEQRALGERKETLQVHRSPHPCHDAAMRAILLGRTLMAERIFDIKVGVRFLNQSQKEDVKSIGVMGNSLGGTLAVYSGALLEDIEFVVAGSCVANFDDSLLSIYHCADLYIPGIRKYFEFGDILGLIAPKPLLVVQGKNDPIFPKEGLRKAVDTATKIYEVHDCGKEKLQVLVGDGGHMFYAKLASQGINKFKHKGYIT